MLDCAEGMAGVRRELKKYMEKDKHIIQQLKSLVLMRCWANSDKRNEFLDQIAENEAIHREFYGEAWDEQ